MPAIHFAMAPTENDFYMTFTFYNPLLHRLPNPVDLTDYEVALTFITVPYSFHNVSAGWIEVRVDGTKARRVIPAGFYLDANNLVEAINKALESDQIVFSYDSVQHRVTVKVEEPRHSIMLSPGLAAILRLPRGTLKGPNRYESYSSILFSGWSQVFYVTTDFTQPQMCNGRMDGILAVFSTGAKEYWSNNATNFVPVKPGIVEFIGINIVTPSMQRVQFLSGGVTVVLHFRKRKR